jgi:D-glycero-D-manno-heptose 1,7-bisphosphate phosphatase
MIIYLKNTSPSLEEQLSQCFESKIEIVRSEESLLGKEVLKCEGLDFLPFNPRDLIRETQKLNASVGECLHLTANIGQELILINKNFEIEYAGKLDIDHNDGYELGKISYHINFGTSVKNQKKVYLPLGRFSQQMDFRESRPALFLDRDGIINKDNGYVYKYEDIIWNEEAIELIKYANEKKYLIFVLTNQSGISQGFYTEEDVNLLHQQMDQHLNNKNALIDHWYYSPYSFKNAISGYKFKSLTRKPGPGMLLAALSEYNINISRSFMIGDKISDHLELPGPQYFHLVGSYDLENATAPVYNSLTEIKKFLK